MQLVPSHVPSSAGIYLEPPHDRLFHPFMFMDKKPSQLQSTNIHASKQLIMTYGMAPQLTPQLEPTQCLQGQGQG